MERWGREKGKEGRVTREIRDIERAKKRERRGTWVCESEREREREREVRQINCTLIALKK